MTDPSEPRLGTAADRVLEPRGAAGAVATHLDPDPRRRPGEVLVALEHLLLDPVGETGVARASGGVPERQRAALLEAATDRGGLPPDLAGAALVGRVAEAEAGDLVGRRVGVVPPVGGVPLWLRDVSRWPGGRHVPCEGHAVLPGPESLVLLPDGPQAETVAMITAVGHVPALVQRAARSWPAGELVLVIGGATVAGALAVRSLATTGGHVLAVVTTLAEARVARALGAVEATIAPLDPPREGARSLLADVADLGFGAPVAVVLADDRAAAITATALVAASSGADVVALEPRHVDGIVREASGGGCSPLVVTGRTLQVTPGDPLADLSDLDAAVRDVAAWRAGVGEVPTSSGPEDA